MDEEFNREEKKFVNLEKAVRTLVRNISTYLEQVQVKLPQNVLWTLYIRLKSLPTELALSKMVTTLLQNEFWSTKVQLPVHKSLTFGPPYRICQEISKWRSVNNLTCLCLCCTGRGVRAGVRRQRHLRLLRRQEQREGGPAVLWGAQPGRHHPLPPVRKFIIKFRHRGYAARVPSSHLPCWRYTFDRPVAGLLKPHYKNSVIVFLFGNSSLWLIHTAWNRGRDRDKDRDGHNRKQWFPSCPCSCPCVVCTIHSVI